jgi:type IV pilus assembly protein PilQ
MKQAQAQPGPAALDPDGHGIEVLEEGGLLEGKVYTGRRISLDFKDVEIDDVLRLIAEVSDLNIIAGDEVQGQVTIRLVDVPWDQALDVILLTKGLGFVRVGNVLRIAPAEVLKSEEDARLQEKRAKEKLEDLVVKLQPVNYANVKEVSKMVKRLLTARGTVDIDVRTNTVILKDIPHVIEEATALIKAIDTQTPQVMIEAKIVEANLDYLREVGSRWGVGVQPFEDAFDTGSDIDEDVGGDDFTFQPVQDILGNTVAPNNIAVSNPITELATGVVNVGAFLLDDRFNLDVELEAAESEGEGKVISSPRVVTLDNRKASIEQGVSIPFQTFENGDAKLEFIDAVLRLDVTPHITSDKSIIMKIEVQRNAPDDSVPTPTGSPAIAKNEAETETLVRDGQTLVIGGIYVVRTAERQSRVPYFHKIPVLGNAFKSNEKRDARQELLVFVTPRVVVNPDLGS